MEHAVECSLNIHDYFLQECVSCHNTNSTVRSRLRRILLFLTNFKQFLTRPLPTDAETFWQVEPEVHQSAAQLGDLITLQILEQAHQDTGFVETAVKDARQKRNVPL